MMCTPHSERMEDRPDPPLSPSQRLKEELILARDTTTDQQTANLLRRTIRRLEKLERLARQMLE